MWAPRRVHASIRFNLAAADPHHPGFQTVPFVRIERIPGGTRQNDGLETGGYGRDISVYAGDNKGHATQHAAPREYGLESIGNGQKVQPTRTSDWDQIRANTRNL